MKKKYFKKIASWLIVIVFITNSLLSFNTSIIAQESSGSAPINITPQPTPTAELSPTKPSPTVFPTETVTPIPTILVTPTVEPTATPSATIVPTPITTTSTPAPLPTGQINLTPTEIPNTTPSPSPTIAPTSQSTTEILQNFINESSSSAGVIDYAIKLPFDGSYPISLSFGETPDDPVLQKDYESFGIIAHDGIDYELPENTKVLTADRGIILSAGPGIYGTTVTIYHTWGITYYGHLSSVSVEPGQIVETGELIGYSGHTGLTTGPHLHFSVKPKNPDLQNGFHGMVDPNIYLDPKPQSEILGISNAKKTGKNLKVFRSNENPDIEFTINDNNINYSLRDSSGKRIYVQKTITKKNNKKYFGISGVRDFRPGKYTLKMTNSDGEAEEQEFYWGVLAVNTNKSVYLPGETAYLQMASLDDSGHTLCSSNLKLEITNPENKTDSLEIKKSDTCGADNVTNNPDYFSYYDTSKTGIYQMKLTNKDNGYEITDSFEVKRSLPFEVERVGATRINPFKASYKTTIKVKANEDFDGTIKEQVPQNFKITPETGIKVETVKDITEISWDKKIKAGEVITLQYEYDAPNESPQFYLLGPIELVSSDRSVQFQEARQWQIASDATQAYTSGSGNWTSPVTGSVTIELHGGGGGGGYGGTTNKWGGGGGAGGQVSLVTFNATKNTTYAYAVGGLGAAGISTAKNGGVGGDTTFVISGSTKTAKGGDYGRQFSGTTGIGGTGSTTGGVGDTVYAGGSGGTGTTGGSGGGGSGAGSTGTGNSATGTPPITGGVYKANNGGAGGNGNTSNAVAGTTGGSYGGGGGGGTKGSIGAAGAGGYILITYPDNISPTVALNTPTNGATGQSTTPTLNFTGTDADSDTIEYNVQVDTVSTFDSQQSGTGFDLKYIKVGLAKTGTPTDNLILTIRSGSFSGTSLGASDPVAASSISGQSQYLFTFGTPITLDGSSTYYMTLARDGARSTANYISPQFRDSINIYPNGLLEVRSNGTWDINGSAGHDLSFITYDASMVAHTQQGSSNGTVGLYGGTGTNEEVGQSFSNLIVGSPLISAFSTDETGFSAGASHPTASGVEQTYTVQTALAANTLYYWRVRAIDPLGTNTYGAWSSIYSFTTSASPTVVLNTPTDTATGVSTTPDLVFTGTDVDADEIEYNVQVDTVNSFDGGGSGGFNLKYIDVNLSKNGSPVDNFSIDVRSDSISGSSLGTSDNVAGTSITSKANYRFTFTTPIALSASTKYYMVIRRSGARDTINYVAWWHTLVSVFGGGGRYTNNSGTWTSESATQDFRFILYDESTTAIITQDTDSGSGTLIYGGTGTNQEQGQSFTTNNDTPLLSKFSVTPDDTFTDVTNGADTHPFASGDQIKYTIQAGNTLNAGTTYYWRVRAIDPLGSNTYGAWSSIYSFTTAAGGSTTDQQMHHGTWFNNDIKQPFSF